MAGSSPAMTEGSVGGENTAMSAAITLDMLRAASSADFPVIDLGDYRRGDEGALWRVAAELRRALENIGFLIVVNHGVAAELTDGIVDEARRFHALPLDEKLKLATGRGAGAGFTGYLPSGEYSVKTSEVNDNDKPDLNEAFFMDRERAPDDPEVLAGKLFREPNKWPDGLPGFRTFLLRY
jgi:isopenicillin N synthase-like dioxygenase